jgi:hypothetical protein
MEVVQFFFGLLLRSPRTIFFFFHWHIYFCLTYMQYMYIQEKLPPTDSRLRPDQRYLENGEYEMANSEKLRLEQRQRQVNFMQLCMWVTQDVHWPPINILFKLVKLSQKVVLIMVNLDTQFVGKSLRKPFPYMISF